MLKSITLEVVGDQRLVCESCELRVKRVLKGMAGVDEVRASSRSQRIEVLFDTATVDVPGIADRLREAGYETRTSMPTRSGA